MIMKAGSVSAAAEAMHVSQPSVSRLLKDLEIDTGLQLFDRSQGRLVPTTQGIMFHAEVAKSFSSARKLFEVAGEIRELNRGVLRLGAMAALSLEAVPAAMRRFQADHPKTISTVSVRSSAEMVSAVAAQFMDVAIVDAGVAFLDTIAVAEHSWNNVCVMSEGHALAKQQNVGIEELADHPFVSLGHDYLGRSSDGRRLRDAVADNIAAEAFQSFLACAFVKGSDALAVVDPFTAAFYSGQGLTSKPLKLDIPFRIAVIVNHRSATSAVVKAFLRVLSDALEFSKISP